MKKMMHIILFLAGAWIIIGLFFAVTYSILYDSKKTSYPNDYKVFILNTVLGPLNFSWSTQTDSAQNITQPVRPIVFNHHKFEVFAVSNLATERVVATDWPTGNIIWEYVIDQEYEKQNSDPNAKRDIQEQFVTDIYIDEQGKLNVVRGMVGDKIDPETGKVEMKNASYTNQEFLKNRREALRIARAQLWTTPPAEKEKYDRLQRYALVEIRQLKDNTDKWYVKYDLPDTFDAATEMTVDVKTGVISDYRDSWV